MSDFYSGGKPDPAGSGDPYSPFTHAASTSAATTGDERTWGMLCHLATLAGYAIPFGNIIGPLIVWLVKKDESAFVDDQGKEALNFQISVTIYTLVAAILVFVLIGLFLLIALLIFDLVVTIMAAVKASQGEYYRYPLCIRFIS